VFPKILALVISFYGLVCLAQEPGASAQQPQVKVNVLNVCTPSADEQQEIASALTKIPKHPAFSEDFEVDRGRSMLDQNASPLPGAASSAVADFVRLRRDISGSGPYSNVQYSFSQDSQQMVETLVFRVGDAKDLLQVSIEDSASSVTSALAMLGSSTPASRIRLERFGKSSVVLARCSGSSEGRAPDQSQYEPLFRSASSVLANYRNLFGVKTLVPGELARIASISTARRPSKQSNAAHK
jgi:hypothetical protein